MVELAAFDPVLALFERNPPAWLKNLHRQAVNRGGFAGDLDSYMAQFDPQVDWTGLRDEITFALQGRGTLATWAFEKEFARGAVAEMGIFRLLGIPAALMEQCRPTLRARPETDPRPDDGPAAPPPVLLMGGANAMVAEGWGHVLRARPCPAGHGAESLGGGGHHGDGALPGCWRRATTGPGRR